MAHEIMQDRKPIASERRPPHPQVTERATGASPASSVETLRSCLGNHGVQILYRQLSGQSGTGAGAQPRAENLERARASPVANITLSQPGDVSEQEADRVAEIVMRMREPAAQSPAISPASPAASIASAQRLCTDCEEESANGKSLAKPATTSGVTIVLNKSVDPGKNFGTLLGTDGGSPLPANIRAFMEPRFGVDFSGVRVHAGDDAARLNRMIGAQAVTYGRDVYLGEGQSELESDAGRKLLAHELTHTIQQGASDNPGQISRFIQCSWIDDRIDWVRMATHDDNWAEADPPGAYFVLNGLSMDDMVRVLRALSPATRKKLSDNLDEHAVGFDRSRLQLGLTNAATAPTDIEFQKRSENLLWAIRSGNFATPPSGAFYLLVAAKGSLRERLLAALNRDAIDTLIAHRDEASTVPGAGDVTTAIDWKWEVLLPGDVVVIGGKKYVIYDDEVRSGGSVSWVARNPGNIRAGDRYGAIRGKKYHTSKVGDFAIFSDEATGMMAIIAVLQGYGHVSVLQALNKYAPSSDHGNDPNQYARLVARRLGVSVNTFIDTLSVEQFAVFADQIKIVEGWIEGTTYGRADPALPEGIRHRL